MTFTKMFQWLAALLRRCSAGCRRYRARCARCLSLIAYNFFRVICTLMIPCAFVCDLLIIFLREAGLSHQWCLKVGALCTVLLFLHFVKSVLTFISWVSSSSSSNIPQNYLLLSSPNLSITIMLDSSFVGASKTLKNPLHFA